MELLILYARVQIYTSDYRLISKTVKTEQILTSTAICATVVLHGPAIFYFFFRGQIIELIITFPKANLSYEVIQTTTCTNIMKIKNEVFSPISAEDDI